MSSIGKYLLDQLYERGVRQIFGVPGDYVLRFNKLIDEHPIRFINTTRENTAGYMADTCGRIQGLGVACITYGVGINIVNALAQAYVENSPLVLISGAAASHETVSSPNLHHLINTRVCDGRDYTQFELFRNLTVDQALLDDPDTAMDQIDRVLHNCLLHKRPVYIELPRDMVDRTIHLRPSKEFQHPDSDPEALREAIAETIRILKESEKPVFWLGHEVQRFKLLPYILPFAQHYNIPITTSILGKGAISELNPQFAGVYQGALSDTKVSDFVEKCDLLLQVGVLYSDLNTGIFSADFSQKHRIVINSNSITIDHHIYQNVNFTDFLHALSKVSLNLRYRNAFPTFEDRKRMRSSIEKDRKLTSDALFECISSHVSQNNILFTDIGDCLFGCSDIAVQQDAFFACTGFASLGFCIPGAIAAQLIAPHKRVIAVVGDGAFQMTGTELSTAIRYHVDPIIIVINNQGYGTERPIIEGEFNNIVNWNYSALPQLLGGGEGAKAETEDQFEKAIQHALHTRGTYQIIEAVVEKTDFSTNMRRFEHYVASHHK